MAFFSEATPAPGLQVWTTDSPYLCETVSRMSRTELGMYFYRMFTSRFYKRGTALPIYPLQGLITVSEIDG